MTAEASLNQYLIALDDAIAEGDSYEAQLRANWKHNDDRWEWIEDVIVQTDFVVKLYWIKGGSNVEDKLKAWLDDAEDEALENYINHKMKERGLA